MKEIAALIAVKGDSERVPRKNIRSFGDTNLLELKIKQIKKVREVSKIVVSSESEEALEIAKSLKVNIHKRNPKYSSSSIPMSEVYSHLANEVESDYIMWVPVTNPLADTNIYKEAIDKFNQLDETIEDCLLSVNKVQNYLVYNGVPVNFVSNPWPRSQDLEGMVELNFVVNILKRKDMINWGSLVGRKPYYFEIAKEDSIDIDFPIDFDLCELIYNKRKRG